MQIIDLDTIEPQKDSFINKELQEGFSDLLFKVDINKERDIFTKDSEELFKSILKSIEYLQELEDKQMGIEYFEILMRYIFSAGKDVSKKDINKIVQKIENTYPEGSERVMTLAEILRKEGIEKGMEKGMEKGIEKGKTKALEKAVIKLLTKKFGVLPEELKIGISKLDAVTLEIIIDGIFEYESLEDVKKYIL